MSANESANETSRPAPKDMVNAVLALSPQQRTAFSEAVRNALLAAENTDGMDVSTTATAAKSSGLTYYKSIHSIQYKGREIGLIKKEGSQYSLRAVTPHQNGPPSPPAGQASPAVTAPHQNEPPTLPPADPASPATNLTDAWAIALEAGNKKVHLEGLKRALSTRTQQLWWEELLINAVNECNQEFLFTSGGLPVGLPEGMGEMFFQQTVYSAFSRLLVSFANPLQDRYAADQDVSSSSSAMLRRGSGNAVPCQITMQPDSTLTLRPKRDGLAMLEIKAKEIGSCFDQNYRRDYDKCVLMTASTALMLLNCGMDVDKIVLPFIIGTGATATLFVMCIDSGGNPVVKFVPIFAGPMHVDISMLAEARSKMFVALAFFISRLRRSLTVELFQQISKNYSIAVTGYTRAFTKRKTDEKPNEPSPKSSRTDDVPAPENTSGAAGNMESMAEQAASCEGLFTSIEYPGVRILKFDESSCDLQYQERSPFYFRGVHAASGLSAFLKVWREEDAPIQSITSELRNLKSALDAGVPVASPILQEVLKSQVGGTMFYILATQFVDEDVMRPGDVLPYARSLVSAVDSLNSKAGILHCDVKPANTRWIQATETVKLIDFGHAQLEANAKHYRSTEGYEAPELLVKQPHSRKTDAYAVGMSLHEVLDIGGAGPTHDLVKGVAERLVVDNPSKRWTLKEALAALGEPEEARFIIHPLSGAVGPPKKTARTTVEIPMDITV